MSVIWTRTGIMKPERYKEATERADASLAAFKEKTGVKAALYHQLGGDIGRLLVMAVFDDLAAYQQIMRDAIAGNPDYVETQQQNAACYLDGSRKEGIWIGRQ